MRCAVLIAAVLALGACEKADHEPGPGGVTIGEAKALDEAAQMIDARQPPEDLLRPLAGQPTGTAGEGNLASDSAPAE